MDLLIPCRLPTFFTLLLPKSLYVKLYEMQSLHYSGMLCCISLSWRCVWPPALLFNITISFCWWLYWTVLEAWLFTSMTPISFLNPPSVKPDSQIQMCIHPSSSWPPSCLLLGRAFSSSSLWGRGATPTPCGTSSQSLKKVCKQPASLPIHLLPQWVLWFILPALLPGSRVINTCKYFYSQNPWQLKSLSFFPK